MNARNRVEPLESRTLLAVTGLPIQIGGTGWDFGQRVASTPDGGFIATGLFAGTVDFDPGPGQTLLTSQADTDIYIAKYDSTGALQWAEQIGGKAHKSDISDRKRIDIAANPERLSDIFLNGVGSQPAKAGEFVNDLKIGPDGSIYLVGDFLGQVDFDPGPGTKIFKTFDGSYYDGFVLKLDSAGALTWADQIGGRFTDTANAVALDGSGNVLVTGLYSRDVTFLPADPIFSFSTLGRENGYVMKLDSAGNLQWANSFGGATKSMNQRNVGYDVTTDSLGNVYVAGSFSGTADFDPSTTGIFNLRSVGDTDGFLAKYSPTGKFRSAYDFGGRAFDALNQVAVDSHGDVIIAGYFEGKKFDADPTAGVQTLIATPEKGDSSPSFTDGFVEKLHAGKVAWVQQLMGTNTELIGDLKLDSADNIIVGGAYYGTLQFGTGGPTDTSVLGKEFKDQNDMNRNNSYDAFLWKLTPAGSNVFADTFGGERDDFGVGVAVQADNSLLLTGRFASSDFDLTSGSTILHPVGLSDAFIAAFDANGDPQL